MSQSHSLVAFSTDTSSFVIWKCLGRKKGLEKSAIVPGPPVDFGKQEEEYAQTMGEWYWRLKEELREEMKSWEREDGKRTMGAKSVKGET